MTCAPIVVNSAYGENLAKATLDPHPPAVIVGADADGLATARCLGKAGIPVCICDSDLRRPGMHSRYVRPFVLKGLSGPPLIEGLLAVRSKLSSTPLLFLTGDLQVSTISEHREQLQGAFSIRMSESSSVRELLHKFTFQQLAERNGFLVPRAVGISGEKDLAKLSQINFPVVIKPGNKELFFDSKAPRAQKVDSREEAESICRKVFPEAPDLIVQEWIEGQERDIYFCLQYRGENGITVSSFTGRKLRSWPPDSGSTASCTAAPEVESVLTRLTRDFFDRANLVGFCSMEFKLDRRSGKFFMIEPTIGRADWQEEVAVLNGVNIPLAAYRYEVGLPSVSSRNSDTPRTWVYPPSYFRSFICSPSRAGRSLIGSRSKTPCWSADDPVPSVFFLLEWIRKLWSPFRWRELARQRQRMALPNSGR